MLLITSLTILPKNSQTSPLYVNSNHKVEEIKSLQTKLRIQTINQNQKDLNNFKEKLSICFKRINEVEANISEIKHIRPDEFKKYENLGTNLLISEKKPHHESNR